MSATLIQQLELQKKIRERSGDIEESLTAKPSQISALYKDTGSVKMAYPSHDVDADSESDEESVRINSPPLEDSGEPSFFFLDKNNGVLQYDLSTVCETHTDITKPLTIYMCGYDLKMEGHDPFLLYVMQQEGGEYTFPQFKFTCPNNVQADTDAEEMGPLHVYFKNECSKVILDIMDLNNHRDAKALDDVYKGYVQDKKDLSVVYVFLDYSGFSIQASPTINRVWGSMDELIYCRKMHGLAMNTHVSTLFDQHPSLIHIKDRNQENVEIPISMYLCEYMSPGSYTNVYQLDEETVIEDASLNSGTGIETGTQESPSMSATSSSISLIDERIDHPILGNFYYFSVEPLSFEKSSIFKIRRFVGFLDNPVYVFHSLTQTVQTIRSKNTVVGSVSSSISETLPNGAGSIIPNIVSYFSGSSGSKKSPSHVQEDVESKIQTSIDSNDVVVFIDPECPYCKEAIRLLTEHKTTHTVIECDSEMRAELKKITSVSSVPSIWIKGVYVGGCNDGPEEWMGIKKLIETGDLDKRLSLDKPKENTDSEEHEEHEEHGETSVEHQIKELSYLDNNCIFFKEVIEQKNVSLWCIKSKDYFMEI
jgi:glutaredoxin-related protein